MDRLARIFAEKFTKSFSMKAALLIAFPALLAGSAPQARAAETGPCANGICWKIENRFRLFSDARDFSLHEQAWAATAAEGRGVLAMERWLNGRPDSPAQGWAAGAVDRLCFDEKNNVARAFCVRDGVRENYINPLDFAVRLDADPVLASPAHNCEWTANRSFFDASGKVVRSLPGCANVKARLRRGATALTLKIVAPDGGVTTKTQTVTPRAILVAGVGDSFTSGDGNPDRPVELKAAGDLGMCYRRALTGERFFLPTRADSQLNKACDVAPVSYEAPEWVALRARWLHAPCHRSLYSHQARAALALALENPQRAVTYIPLGCTGAEIGAGLIGAQKSRERLLRNGLRASASVMSQLRSLDIQTRAAPSKPDVTFLSVGGNDVGFAALVANIVVLGQPERGLLPSNTLFDPSVARGKLPALDRDFRRLRARLGPLVGGDLSRVVYTTYADPLTRGSVACPSTRLGFDGHPAFGFDGAAAAATSAFVNDDLLPRLRKLALCEPGAGCAHPAAERMRYAEGHRAAFADHGVCAENGADPAFDRDCLANGDTFKTGFDPNPLGQPFKHCVRAPAGWRAYAPRARWLRTANDSYLSAMSFADSAPLKGAFLGDAMWGVSTMVYGGAAHPTAEGHAAMADAALVEARAALAAAGK